MPSYKIELQGKVQYKLEAEDDDKAIERALDSVRNEWKNLVTKAIMWNTANEAFFPHGKFEVEKWTVSLIEVDDLSWQKSGEIENSTWGILSCSFCGHLQNAVKKLIAGPSVYICDECVGICTDIIKDMEKRENGKAR